MIARQQRLIWRKTCSPLCRNKGFASSTSRLLPRATDSRPSLDSNPGDEPGSSGKATAAKFGGASGLSEGSKGISFVSSRPPNVPAKGRKSIAPPAPPPKPELPSSFAPTYLSTPSTSKDDGSAPLDDSGPDRFFTETLHGHLLTSFLPHNQLHDRPDPTMAVVCPHEGGEYIIRRTVDEAAALAGAEVLRIDAIEVLGLGEWGALGKAGSSIQLSPNPLHIDPPPPDVPSGREDASPDISSIFGRSQSSEFEEPDGGVESFHVTPTFSVTELPFARAPGGFRGGQGGGGMPAFGVLVADPSEAKERASLDALFDAMICVEAAAKTQAGKKIRPRVVYIQDASAMAETFSQWWPSLLRAVRKRRREGNASDELVQPTTIVLGVNPSLLHAGGIMSDSVWKQGNSPGDGQAGSEMKPGILDLKIRGKGGSGKSRKNQGLGELWESSGESDVKGRHLRLTKRLEAFRPSDEASLRSLIPSFEAAGSSGSQLSTEERPMSLADIINNMRGENKPSTPAPGSGKPDDVNLWKVVGTLPKRRNVKLERAERLGRRSAINYRLMARAVGQRGGVCADLSDEALGLNQPPEDALEEKASLDENFGTSVWPLSTLEHLASISIANELRGGSAKTPEIGWSAIATASLREESGDRLAAAFVDRVKAHQIAAAQQYMDVTDAGKSARPLIKTEDTQVAKLRKDKSLSSHEKRLLDCVVDINKVASTKFKDVILPESTIDGIRTVVSLPIMYPEAYRKGILASHTTSGVLMFGPPGTGKSLAARALASESGARMLALNPSDLNNAYVGETEKLVKAAFTLARKLSPCIIFVDDCDSLFGGRSSGSFGGAQVQRQLLGEMLSAMDGLSSASENRESNVVVIAATNRPFDLDEAMLRRLPRRVLIDLPSLKERRAILQSLLRDEVLGEDIVLDELAKRTDTYSGSDLKHVCVNAALAALKETLYLPWKTDSPSLRPVDADLEVLKRFDESSNPVKEVVTLPLEPSEPVQQETLLVPRVASQPERQVGELENFSAKRHVHNVAEESKPSKVEAQQGEESTRLLDEFDEFPTPIPDADSLANDSAGKAGPAPALRERVLHLKHFDTALREITPSSSEQGNLTELRKWAEQYGEGGTKRGRTGAYGAKFGFGGIDPGATDDPAFGRVRPEGE